MTIDSELDDQLDARVGKILRRTAWVGAILSLLAGVLGLFFPQTGLTVIALIVGAFLVAAGILRISSAITTEGLTTGWRWLLGIIGGLVVVAGILALNNPFGVVVAFGIIVGIGLLLDGVGYIAVAVLNRTRPGNWVFIVAGILFLIFGILVLIVPAIAAGTLYLLLCIALIIVGVLTVAGLLASRRRA